MASELSNAYSNLQGVSGTANSAPQPRNFISSFLSDRRAEQTIKQNNIDKAIDRKDRAIALKLAAKQRSEDMKYRADAKQATSDNRHAIKLESNRRYNEDITRKDDVLAADASVDDINIPRSITVDNIPPAIYTLDEAIARRVQNGNPMKLGENLPSVPQVNNTPEQSEFLAMYNGIKDSPTMTDVDKRIALREIGAVQQARLTQGTDKPRDVQPLVDNSGYFSGVTDYFSNRTLKNELLTSAYAKVNAKIGRLGINRWSNEADDLREQARSSVDKQMIPIKKESLSILEQVDKMSIDELTRMKKEADAERVRIGGESKEVLASNRKTVSDPDVTMSKELIKGIVAKAPKSTINRRVTSTEFKKSISEARKVFKDSLKTSTLTARQKNLRISKFNKVASAEQKAFNLEQATIGQQKFEAEKITQGQVFKIHRDNNNARNNLDIKRDIAKLKAKLPLSLKDKSIVRKNNATADKYNRGD